MFSECLSFGYAVVASVFVDYFKAKCLIDCSAESPLNSTYTLFKCCWLLVRLIFREGKFAPVLN
jgi:hypothetical protein